MDFHDEHFDSIQALRGIAALFVVLEHVRFLNCGAFGVDVFFCISGFMIMFSTHKSTAHFLAKRLIRILPFYYIMTLGSYILVLLFPGFFAYTKADPVFLIKSLLFLPFDIGGGAIQPLLRVGWTINYEIFFYLLFYVSLRISHKYRGLVCGGMIVSLAALGRLLPLDHIPYTFYSDPILLEFLFGILAYYLCRRLYGLHRTDRLPKACLPLSLAAAVLCLLGLIATKPYVNALLSCRFALWGLPALLLVTCSFLMGLYLKTPAVLVNLGNISYSLYLLHYYPVTFLDRMVFDFESFSPAGLLGVVIGLAVSVALAVIGHELIEKRLTRRLRVRLLHDRARNS